MRKSVKLWGKQNQKVKFSRSKNHQSTPLSWKALGRTFQKIYDILYAIMEFPFTFRHQWKQSYVRIWKCQWLTHWLTDLLTHRGEARDATASENESMCLHWLTCMDWKAHFKDCICLNFAFVRIGCHGAGHHHSFINLDATQISWEGRMMEMQRFVSKRIVLNRLHVERSATWTQSATGNS